MDSSFSYLLLLLSSLQYCWQRVGGQPFYTIDSVTLNISSTAVQTGTPVYLSCEVSISHNPLHQLTHTFMFICDDGLVHNITTKDTVAVYVLSSARAADSGTYECEVRVQEKSKTSVPTTLYVTGLQTPVLNLSNTQPFESEEIVATCSAPEEKGDLRFYFYQLTRSGASQLIKHTMPRRNSSETKLVLKQAGDSYLYCNYNLPMFTAAGNSDNSNKVQVLVKAFSISPIMNVLPSKRVFEGDIIEVVCKVISQQGNIDVFLTKDKTILKKATGALNHQYKVKAGDSGELVCKAEWGKVQKESSLTITVRELFSKPHLKVVPKDVFEGESFNLTCSISHFAAEVINNETMQFSIFKNGIRLTHTATYSAVARASENANYTCKAKAYGKDIEKESAPESIIVKVPVSQPTLSALKGRIVLGKPFYLHCHSDRGSLPITYTLYGPNREAVTKVVSRPGDQAIFNTSAIHKKTDIMNFLCHAKNHDYTPPMTVSGQTLQHTAAIIEPVSRPELTVYPNAGDVSEGSDMSLVCSVQRGTPPITFTWYHSEKTDPLDFQTLQLMKGSYSVKGIREEDRGDYYCVSTNQAGDIKRSYTVTVGVRMAGWKKGLIAASCILLTVALILAILIKKGLLPFRGSKSRSLSVKSAGTKVERLSLTQAEVNQAANVTPGVMGRSVWSEHISGSESDDQNSVASPEEPETQYTEVQTQQINPSKAPAKKGTDTVYSEVQNSKQGAAEQADGGSVEYAQLNRDTCQDSDHCNHGNPSGLHVQDDHIDDIDDIDDIEDIGPACATQPDCSN